MASTDVNDGLGGRKLTRPYRIRGSFQCPCGCGMDVVPALVQAILKLAEEAGRDIILQVGARCKKYNESLKARGYKPAPKSMHLKGIAADVTMAGMSVADMATAAERVPEFANGGIGVYPSMHIIHVDLGRKRRWKG